MKPANEFLARVPATFYSAFRADVQSVPPQGLWLHLNPRTGKTYFEGGGEPEVQEVLRPGIICEMHSEEKQGNLLEEFSRFGYSCKSCGTSHILALPQ
jgi:hypothetical protein